ncbi:DUF421 domain-containing protein [Nocardia otitidiscaviarum]|uniref:DUF421 domain-containing protein n=1 Tax=Nocardia otitidiscaviarum TaxID=1823 RepID=UPI0018933DAC|nr:YetF domain-containing protein [Nocardia otitidiscaviarum]MBF6181750.1 DUF421 domain-containing protein [Nocardia otitidiscaviarum]
MLESLGITVEGALAVVFATAGMYFVMVVLVRLLGQRVLSGMSSFDLVAVIAFGAVIGRAALGDSPRLAGGIVALVTLMTIQALVGVVRGTRVGSRAVVNRPVLLMAGREVLESHMRTCHVSRAELYSRLRQAGIAHTEDVGAVIFEPSGTISVLRAGRPIDPNLLIGVVGAELLDQDPSHP